MGSAINPEDINRFEFTPVYEHPDAQVDIVLVHGLNGHPRDTWTSKKNKTFWPIDLLPVTLKGAKVRLLVYGYNVDVFGLGKSGPSSDKIYQHAQTLVTTLALHREMENANNHPIIWIAHSLGGILVKRALNYSQSLMHNNADDQRSIYISTYGIMFLGTPHLGSDAAKWGLLLQRMVKALIPKKAFHSENQMVKTLQTNSEILQEINLKFLEIYPKFQICMAHEGLETDLHGTKAFIVDQTSASPMLNGVAYFGIEATHSGMCKFDSKNSPGYANVAGSVKKWVEASPPVIEARRQKEIQDRIRIRQQEASELLPRFGNQPPRQSSTGGNTPGTSHVNFSPAENRQSSGFIEAAPSSRPRFEFEAAEYEDADVEMADPGSVASSTIVIKSNVSIPPETVETSDQIFVKPPGFRPNSLFVGRETELELLHKMLFDKDRRAKGTSAVLIQCLPGGGKTHLAREYVYNHQKDYPGGIFWTRAKSFEELAAAYWDIAKKTVFKDNVDKKAFSPDDSEQFIKLVKKWLNNRQEWLLVFDGIHFDDTERLMKFLPDQRNTSIIYTSTEKAVSGDYHFNDPQVIRLPTLSAREARELLLLELGKKEPSQKDLEYSMDLVRAMEFLPIVIHTAAQRLKMTDEPLSRYAKSYASEPRLRGLGTYKVVVEQLEHMGARESLNLMQILVFFSQHIPVEMVSLGLRILDIPVKAFEPVTGRSLNNTFRFLNIFALVDRNETRAHSVHSVHSSQSSKGSRDMLAENLDVIRLHGVVQGFFIDTMNGDESLPHWLSRAVGVFCCSYDSASSRIASKSHTGLVEDYRLYEIHGNRLKQHVVRFKKRYPVLDEAHQYLDQSLEKIKTEIEQKTPESSQNIAGGQSDAFQTSIFDRTSSSSDTGPETPGRDDDERNLRLGPQAHWLDQGHLESPSSLTHDMEYQRHHQIYDARPYEMPDGPTNSHNNQHSLHQSEEGYESDMEGSVAMTLQPSQRTIQQQSESPTSPASAEWTKVERRAKKPERLDLHQHRTIKRMENQRYRDRAGSFRAVSALDPRTSHETAHGHFQSSSSRAESRGRLSGHSSAEVALTHIAQASPAPARGRGKIRDRPSSQRPEHRRVRSGIASYASAVTSPTNDTISGLPIPRPKTRDTSTESVCGSAVTSLQRFPLGVSETSSSRSQYTPMPPYPLSPGVERHDPLANPDSNLYNLRDNFDIPMRDAYPRQNENMFHTSDNRQDTHIPNYPTKVYPRMTAPLPLETRARSSSGPLKRDLPHEYSYWHSQGYPANEEQVPSSMSLSSPNIKSTDSPYYPGRPEFSFSSTPARFDGGYTSQPMSRDQSGQSAQSNRSRNGVNIGVGHRRRPSVAETEPIPSLPTFSPTIPPTSYRVYQQNTDPELIHMRKERERTPGYPVTKSPRLGYASHASRESQESLDRWNGSSENLPPPRRTFNPRTPAFTPSIAQPTPRPPSIFSTRAHSTTAVPPPKRNSLTLDQGPYSAPQSKIHSPNPNYTSSRTSPHPLQTSQFPPPPSPPRQYQPTASPPRHLRSFTTLEEPDGLGVGMVRGGGGSGSGSGGMMVGDGKVIGFGDFPEKVDIVGARERVERTWVERGESGLREGSSSVKGVGLGLDFRAGERR